MQPIFTIQIAHNNIRASQMHEVVLDLIPTSKFVDNNIVLARDQSVYYFISPNQIYSFIPSSPITFFSAKNRPFARDSTNAYLLDEKIIVTTKAIYDPMNPHRVFDDTKNQTTIINTVPCEIVFSHSPQQNIETVPRYKFITATRNAMYANGFLAMNCDDILHTQ